MPPCARCTAIDFIGGLTTEGLMTWRAEPGELHLIADRLCERMRPCRRMIESVIEPMFASRTPLDQAIRHVLLGDAKRVRASLALIAMQAAGGCAQDALQVAVAFELLHTASLIHDDIMDGATLRRGRACVHRVFGTGLAITAGDALIFEAYRCLLHSLASHPAPAVERVLGIFTACAAATCRGQALDLGFAAGAGSLRQYLRMIRAKTGSMIEAPLECAAVLADAPPSWCERFRTYGRCLGIAFQIADDANDCLGSEAKAGKTLGNDLRNGSGSALLIYCRESCDPVQRDHMASALHRAGAGDDAEPLIAMLHRQGAIASTQRLAAGYADRARRALQDVGVEPARTQLAAIASIVGHWKVSSRQPPPSTGESHATRQVGHADRFVRSHPA
jgi:geranylgeranyl pyrophosphate synthase